MIEPVMAAGFAWLALAEILSLPQVIGGVIVLIGVYIAERSR